MSSRLLVLLVSLASLPGVVELSLAQGHSSGPQVRALTFADSGRRIAAHIGDQIEITLGTVGPKQYGEPLVSSAAVGLEGTALDWPANPGVPTFIYIFDAAAAGEAQVIVPVINPAGPEMEEAAKNLTFTVTVVVTTPPKSSAAAHAAYAFRTPDQRNPARWAGAWTNLANDARQTFTPSHGRLTGVEVGLAPANPGPSAGEVTLSLLDPEGQVLASVSKTVPFSDCAHARFALPHGGVHVTPGQVYTIRLSGAGGAFGWKYVVGGYKNGAAFFNGKPLLKDERATFLFKSFG